ncbi:wd-40 repeat protein [Stylonychia lemnae]|uniref:Wd-40 repeat protein n=1 Tax=Stylonychia lemnae TaxID=5949 RepID=A0A078BCT2_STYLE|nr:wd-40 repeat protein [Stylonychia lemnae]|eukprot:CDW91027.1 wd-40 repeat protein [Stylonychia lemnae]
MLENYESIYKDYSEYKINDRIGEYIAIETTTNKDDDLVITEIRKLLFMHSKCSQVRGFSDKHDDEGYDMYDAVTIVNHVQELLFAPNFSRFIEYDTDEKVFKIQLLNLDSSHIYFNREVKQDTYMESDYFNIISPHQTTIRNHQKSSIIRESEGKFTRLISESIKEYQFEKASYIEKIIHKNFSTVIVDIPLISLTNRFKFMKNCPLSGNQNWPLIFCCDYSIGVIMDSYIIKKYAINECQNNLLEVQTLVEWSTLQQKQLFASEPSKIYISHGIFFSTDMVIKIDRENVQNLQGLLYKKYINKRRQQNVQIYPVKFDVEQLQSIEFSDDLSSKIGEYLVRSNKRYQKRKRIIFDFSIFDWLLASKLKDIYKTVDIPYDILKSACLAIFPYKRQNILFYLKEIPLMQYVYGRLQKYYEDEGVDCPYYIPFLKDSDGKTPLHYSLSNAKLTDQFLNYLADYPISYCSQNIQEMIPYLIIKGLQKTNYFLDKRFKMTPMLKNFDRERLRILKEIDFSFTGTNTFWFDQKQTIEQNQDLFDENEIQIPTKVMVLDIPNVINQSQNKDLNIFTALRTTEQMEIFESEAVRAIIEYAWPITRKAIIKWMMIPSMVFLVFFMFYTGIVFPVIEDCFEKRSQSISHEETLICQFNSVLNNTSKIIILSFLVYFLAIEIIQAYKDARIYLSSPWNYLDMISIIFVLLTLIIDYMDIDTAIQRPLYAIATLIVWLKSLYYLRIFRNVGYLTSMIIQVVQDMVYFFIILMMTLFAFGNSFFILSQANPDRESRFIKTYPEGLSFTFRLLLGDFDTQKFDDSNEIILWALFTTASIFLIIVLLNLLISIISESYNKIQLNAKNSMYKELASLIYDNYFLTDYELKSDKYILIAKPDCEYIDDIIEERAQVIQQGGDTSQKEEQEQIVQSISKLQEEISEIKAILIKQGQQQYQLFRDTITSANKKDNYHHDNDLQKDDNRTSLQPRVSATGARVSFGFGESIIRHPSQKRRRGTHNSGNETRGPSTIFQEHDQAGLFRRKNTIMKQKNFDIFQ